MRNTQIPLFTPETEWVMPDGLKDLKELEGRLRRTTVSKIRKKKIIMERLDFLLRNAQSTLTYENIKDIIFYGG